MDFEQKDAKIRKQETSGELTAAMPSNRSEKTGGYLLEKLIS